MAGWRQRGLSSFNRRILQSANFMEEDLVVLNPEEEELDLINSKMISLRARVNAEKKAA